MGMDVASAGIVRPGRVGRDAGVVASVVAVASGPGPTAGRVAISVLALVAGGPVVRADLRAVAVDSVGIPPRPAMAGVRVVPGTDVVPIVVRLPSH